MKRIEQRINNFLENRVKPFTINDVANNVKWDGSRKHLTRFILTNPRIQAIGKKREDGKKLNIYAKVETAHNKSGLFGIE